VICCVIHKTVFKVPAKAATITKLPRLVYPKVIHLVVDRIHFFATVGQCPPLVPSAEEWDRATNNLGAGFIRDGRRPQV
jgi:hypothetical protein